MFSAFNLDVLITKLSLLHLSPKVFWQTCFFGRDLFFIFRTLSCQVHLSPHIILKRHCYGHLDSSANPDDCDWIRRLKQLSVLFCFWSSFVKMTSLRPDKVLKFNSIQSPMLSFFPSWIPMSYLWSGPRIKQSYRPGFTCAHKNTQHYVLDNLTGKSVS